MNSKHYMGSNIRQCSIEGTAPENAADTCLATLLKASATSDFFFGWFPPALANIDVLGHSVLLE